MEQPFRAQMSMTQGLKMLETYRHPRQTWDHGSGVGCLMPIKIKGVDFDGSKQSGKKVLLRVIIEK